MTKVANKADLNGLIEIGWGAYKEYRINETRIRCASYSKLMIGQRESHILKGQFRIILTSLELLRSGNNASKAS